MSTYLLRLQIKDQDVNVNPVASVVPLQPEEKGSFLCNDFGDLTMVITMCYVFDYNHEKVYDFTNQLCGEQGHSDWGGGRGGREGQQPPSTMSFRNSQHDATLLEIFGKAKTHCCSRKTTTHRNNYVFSPQKSSFHCAPGGDVTTFPIFVHSDRNSS